MSTRAMVHVYDDKRDPKTPLLSFYHHCDGYPTWLGKEIYEFLSGGNIVNGIGAPDSKTFNGVGCLAASLLAFFKKHPSKKRIAEKCHDNPNPVGMYAGNVYVEMPGHTQGDIEYEYELHVRGLGPTDTSIFVNIIDAREKSMMFSDVLDKMKGVVYYNERA